MVHSRFTIHPTALNKRNHYSFYRLLSSNPESRYIFVFSLALCTHAQVYAIFRPLKRSTGAIDYNIVTDSSNLRWSCPRLWHLITDIYNMTNYSLDLNPPSSLYLAGLIIIIIPCCSLSTRRKWCFVPKKTTLISLKMKAEFGFEFNSCYLQ